MPVNAVQSRSTPESAGQLPDLLRQALPFVLRSRVLDAILTAQVRAGGPVTSHQARAAASAPVLGHSRAFTEVAAAISRLGPDETGRVLVAVGADRKGIARWWVHGHSA